MASLLLQRTGLFTWVSEDVVILGGVFGRVSNAGDRIVCLPANLKCLRDIALPVRDAPLIFFTLGEGSSAEDESGISIPAHSAIFPWV